MTAPRTLWRLAGVCGLVHIVAILVGLALAQPALFEDGTAGIQADYVEADLARSLTGGLIEALGFVLLVPALVFVSRVLGRRSEVGRFAAQTGLACGVGYVAVTLAVGFPAGAAALYGAQHGLDLDVAFALNNVRIFGYFLSLALLGGNVIGIAASALTDGRSRWIGGFGLAAGLALLAGPVLAVAGLQDFATLLWMVWWVGVSVWMLRAPGVGAAAPDQSATDRLDPVRA
jgi:hypothetical protein